MVSFREETKNCVLKGRSFDNRYRRSCLHRDSSSFFFLIVLMAGRNYPSFVYYLSAAALEWSSENLAQFSPLLSAKTNQPRPSRLSLVIKQIYVRTLTDWRSSPSLTAKCAEIAPFGSLPSCTISNNHASREENQANYSERVHRPSYPLLLTFLEDGHPRESRSPLLGYYK